MKRIVFLILTILLVLSVTACSLFPGGDGGNQGGGEPEQHEHTYAETLSFDETHHWYEATCSAEADCATAIKDKAAHTLDAEGKCACGYEKPSAPVHIHTYSETLSYDETHHWYEATCSAGRGCNSCNGMQRAS